MNGSGLHVVLFIVISKCLYVYLRLWNGHVVAVIHFVCVHVHNA